MINIFFLLIFLPCRSGFKMINLSIRGGGYGIVADYFPFKLTTIISFKNIKNRSTFVR